MCVRVYLLIGRNMCAYLPISRDGLPLFRNSNITRDEFASFDILLHSTTNNLRAMEVTCNTGSDVGGE